MGAPTSAPVAGVVVPIRAFRLAKSRLADHLDARARAELARVMAGCVLDAAAGLAVVVVTSAPEVASWARRRGAEVVADPGSLDAAARAGVAYLGRLGIGRAVVAHADLPLVRSFDAAVAPAGAPVAALAPCHRDDGTPVLSVPTRVPFRFAYGPGSFARHAAEARRLGLEVRVLLDPRLRRDVDSVDDLDGLELTMTDAAARDAPAPW